MKRSPGAELLGTPSLRSPGDKEKLVKEEMSLVP
jgi:hypothetical protein